MQAWRLPAVRPTPGFGPFVDPATAVRKRRGCRCGSAATISRAISLSPQSSFQRSLAVRLVRYRNRGVISLGRASPADFSLRYKAGLLAGDRRYTRVGALPRDYHPLWPLTTFQYDSETPARFLARPSHNSARQIYPLRIRLRTRSFSFATTRDLPVGFSYSR